MLADAAQVADGKLYILGGGWSVVTAPLVAPHALAIKVEVPWSAANQRHTSELSLVDEDGTPVSMPTPDGPKHLKFDGSFEIGRPAGLSPGSPLDLALAFSLPPLPLLPGKRYGWQFLVDGAVVGEVWFQTRPPGEARAA